MDSSDNTMEMDALLPNGNPSIPTRSVPFLRQFAALFQKCVQVSTRKPKTFTLSIFAPTVFVLAAYAGDALGGGNTITEESLAATLGSCGTLTGASALHPFDENYRDLPIVMNNMFWTTGFGVVIICLGPLTFAACALVTVSGEATTKMLNVLRALGISEVAYWASWFSLYAILALLNSLFASVAAKAVPVHVFQASSFFAISSVLFVFELALIPFVFFVGAVCGTSGKAVGWMAFVLIAGSVGLLAGLGFQRFYGSIPASNGTSGGMSWAYGTTSYYSSFYNQSAGEYMNEPCDVPLVSSSNFDGNSGEIESTFQSTLFAGCYVLTSEFDKFWDGDTSKSIGLSMFMLLPQYHFGALLSRMIGFTNMPFKKFDVDVMSKTAGSLMIDALPTQANFSTVGGLLSAYSMITQARPEWYQLQKSDNCPDAASIVRSNITICPDTEYSGCPYVTTKNDVNSAPSFFSLLGFLCLQTIGYMLLTVWFAQVVTFGNGVSKPFMFCLFGRRNSANARAGRLQDDEAARAASFASANAGSVILHKISRWFGDFEAVKTMSLEMKPSQLFCLLGHNGAGKSTLIKGLSGELKLTSGDAFLHGISVTEDVSTVRRLIGVCSQFDLLYDTLTAREHLELFGTLRGVEEEKLGPLVTEWLEDVELSDEADHRSSTFSGGMKRRLSVAMATIGDAPVIILDEPTTGMDPLSRRAVWRHIEKIKPNRVAC